MLITGILNPNIHSLISRVRHTNTLVIADRGFPFWPTIETIDISLVDDIPTVLQVLNAIRPNYIVGRIFMASQFLEANTAATKSQFAMNMEDIPVIYEDHDTFKTRVPQAIGLIRTGDTTQYANMIIESA